VASEQVPVASKRVGVASELVPVASQQVLMGSDVLPRKKFIQTHAKNVKNLDI